MAKPAPSDTPGGAGHIADIVAWLEERDPLLVMLDEIEAARPAQLAEMLKRPLATVPSDDRELVALI
jgi:hypothetical protein